MTSYRVQPFLVFRSTIFGLVTWMNITALGFAMWDIVAMKKVGLSNFGPPIFVILNSLVSLFLLAAAIAELFVRNAETARVNLECVWTLAMSILYFASAVANVMEPPRYCAYPAFASVCAASTGMVIVTWLSTASMIIYFLALYISSISHYWAYGAIWNTSVYNVSWFAHSDPRNPASGNLITDLEKRYRCVVGKGDLFGPYAMDSPFAYSDLMNTLARGPSQETLRPTWARSVQTRRGVDQPFALPGVKDSPKGINTRILNMPPPTIPPKAKTCDLSQLDLDLTPKYPLYCQFPESVPDENQPIQLHRLSQWVRAESGLPAQ